MAGAAPAPAQSEVEQIPSDDLPNPLEDKRRELREEALNGVLSGRFQTEERGGSTVVNVGRETFFDRLGRRLFKDKYVELGREKTDRIFVILAEFGDERHPSYPDQDTHPATPGPVRFDGPLVNQIPEPDRTVDNSTVWRPDFSQPYFQDLYFGGGESVKNYYETQSSGRYSVEGTVTNWVRVQFNQARYGRSNGFPCGGSVCSNTWALVRDAAVQWYNDQLAAGRPKADVDAELAEFDVWDRYDHDGDGNFDESDGYIDHFQIVHAGGDQADGDPIYGEDAIWSHRWYANQIFNGTVGPPQNPIGGWEIGTSGIWIGDYTIQPENGGRSVFYHEFAHDLGLPDDYNVLSGGDNNNEHWTLMAQSRLGAKNDGGIGERGGDLGAWNKLQLGWLNYVAVNAGDNKLAVLGPQEYNSNRPQALVVNLGLKEVQHDLGAPAAGDFQWYSGTGNGQENTLTRQVTVPAAPATLSFDARWNIEDCGPDPCDYAYVEVQTTPGGAWTPIPGSITNAGEGNGIDGVSAGWVNATFDLSAYAGQSIGLRFTYFMDPAVEGQVDTAPPGIFVDNIVLGTFSDGAETLDAGWTAVGWQRVGATFTTQHEHYYIAGHRTYVSYDKYLETGPYYFGYLPTLPDKVDHYSYQEGLLISYWDTSYGDNDTFAHPGSGRNLYIDSHPEPMTRSDGGYWRARVQVYDAPFGIQRTDRVKLHHNGVLETINGQSGRPLFDDTKKYWYEELPNHGVKLPALGVKIRVLWTLGTSVTIYVS
jgi:immune inhibitor A